MSKAQDMLDAIKKVLRGDDKDRDLNINSLFWKVDDALYSYKDDDESFEYPYIMELMSNSKGQYAIFSDGGKLYRADYAIGSDDEITITETYQVKIDYPKVESSVNRIKLFRSKDNELLWIGIASSSVLNRSGEIDSTELFDDFEANFSDNDEPYLTLQHLPKVVSFGVVRNVLRLNSLLIAMGVIDEETVLGKVAEERFNSGEWGMSIGFKPTEPPKMLRVGEVEIPVYNNGYLVEISVLLETRAAAYFTKIISGGRGKDRMANKSETKKILLEFVGDENADDIEALLDEADTRERQISDEGLITRDEKPDAGTETDKEKSDKLKNLGTDEELRQKGYTEETEDEPTTETEDVEFILDDKTIDKIVNSVSEQVNIVYGKKFEEFSQSIDNMTRDIGEVKTSVTKVNEIFEEIKARELDYEARLKKVEASDTEKISHAVNDLPPASKRSVTLTHRPTESTTEEPKRKTLRDTANETLEKIGVSEELK